jgi:hypothetical protein
MSDGNVSPPIHKEPLTCDAMQSSINLQLFSATCAVRNGSQSLAQLVKRVKVQVGARRASSRPSFWLHGESGRFR